MQSFLVILLVSWSAALAGWWLWSLARKASELERIRKRLAASNTSRAKGGKGAPPALIRREDRTSGRMVLHLLQRLQLTERLKLLLEQAGLK